MQLAVMNREQRIGIRPQTDTLTLLMSSADLCGWHIVMGYQGRKYSNSVLHGRFSTAGGGVGVRNLYYRSGSVYL